MKFVFITLAVLVVLAVIYKVVKFICVCAYQYASGVVEEYFDAIERESTQDGEPLGFMDKDFIRMEHCRMCISLYILGGMV